MNLSELYSLSSSYYKIAKDKTSGGMLFICPEDKTVLLLKRSEDMSSPGTWSVPGGRPDDDDSSILETAKRESKEELSHLPKNKKPAGFHIVERDNKQYKVFLYFISKNEKEKWNPKIKLDEENEKYKWFKIDKLPKNQHFDLNWIEEKIKSIKE